MSSNANAPVGVDNVSVAASTSLVKRYGMIALMAILAVLMGSKMSGALVSPASSPSSSHAMTYYAPTTGVGAPTNATISNTAAGVVTVSWTNPSSTSTPITSYTVQSGTTVLCTTSGTTGAGQANSCTWTPTAALSSLSVYANAGSTQSSAATVAGVVAPGAPTVSGTIGATVGNGTVSVAFTDGGAGSGGTLTTTGYDVYVNGTVVCTTTASPCVVNDAANGLALGGAYSFTVKAVNPAGLSSASGASNSVTVVATPAAPTSATAAVSYSAGTVNISWNGSTTTGGLPVSYTVYKTGTTSVVCATQSTTTCAPTTSSLAGYNGSFTVSASNQQNGSLASTAVTNVVYVGSIPAAPTTAPTLAVSGTTLTATIPSAGSNSGSILQLETCTTSANSTCTAVGSPVVVSATTTSYNFTIAQGAAYWNVTDALFNGAGQSAAASATSAFPNAATAPGAISAVTVTGYTNSSLSVSWSAPSSGGSAITGYSVGLYYQSGASTYTQIGTNATVTGTTDTFTGLTAGVVYVVKVAAMNAVGTNLNLTASNGNSLNGAPVIGAVSYTSTGVKISWTAVSGSVTSYVVIDASTHAVLGTVAGTASSITVPASSVTAAHTYQVYSVDSAGVASALSAASAAIAAPGAVTGLHAYANSTSNTALVWDLIAGATSYNIVANASNGTILTATSATNSYTFPAATLGSTLTYTFQVEAVNSIGASASGYSAAVSVTSATAANPATAVTATQVAAGKGSVITFSWSAPTTAITGNAITGYTGTLTTASGEVVNCTTSTTSCTISGLTPGAAYSFSVVANAPLGNSAAATLASFATTGVSGPVGGLTAVSSAAGTTINVSWTAPTQYFTWATGYTVTATPATGSAVTCSVTGLTAACTVSAGTTYTVSVVATASLTPGPVTATSAAATTTVTTATVPGAPTGVTAVVSGSNQITVSWTAPASNGGSAVTRYIVTAVTSNSGTVTSAVSGDASTTAATCSGLVCTSASGITATSMTFTVSAGGAFTFTVQAVNAVSASGGTASSASMSVTAVATPGTPSAIYYGTATTGYLVAWPAATAATSYTVTVLGGVAPLTYTTTGTSYSVPASALSAGNTYQIFVTAVNAAGTATSNAASLTSTVPGSPSAGVEYQFNNAAGTAPATVTLSWTAPTTGNVYPVTYTVYTTVNGVVTQLASGLTSTTWSGAYNANGYSVYAVTATGSSNAALSLWTPVAPQSAPAAPTALVASGLPTVTWTPGATGSSNVAVTSYTVTATNPATGAVVTCAWTSGATCTFTTLASNTFYLFSVTETDAYGTSTALTGYAATAVAAPGVVTGVTATLGTDGTSATISWTGPVTTGNSPVSTYLVSVTNTGNSAVYVCPTVLTASSTSCTITGLASGATYSVSVQASNSAGSSSAVGLTAPATLVTPAAATTPANPAAVTITYPAFGTLGVAVTAGTVNAAAVTSYTATATGTNGTTATCTMSALTCTLTGLSNQAYTVVVTATSSQGTSSGTSANATAYSAPDNAALITSATSSALGTIVVGWSAPVATSSANADNAAITGYTVTAVDASGNSFNCGTVAASATSCTIKGLANNTAYTVTVTPLNGAGASTVSASVSATTMKAVLASAPVISSVAQSAAGVVVTWTAPTSTGGLAVSGYNVTALAADGSMVSCPTVAGTSLTCTIKNLSASTAYTISVNAVTAAGSGAAATQAYTTSAIPVPNGIIVQFAKTNAVLTGTAKKQLAALAAKLTGSLHVTFVGFSKSSVSLARSRALAVANYMLQLGVEVKISIQANTGTNLNAVSVSPSVA